MSRFSYDVIIPFLYNVMYVVTKVRGSTIIRSEVRRKGEGRGKDVWVLEDFVQEVGHEMGHLVCAGSDSGSRRFIMITLSPRMNS